MKNTLVIGLLCLGIGFGAAWLVKPAKTPRETAEDLPSKSNTPPPAQKRPTTISERPSKSDNRPEDPKPVLVQGEEPAPDARVDQRRRGQDRFREMMVTRQKAKEEAQIKKLVDRLGLTDAQADQLRAHYAKNREKLQALMEGGEGDWSRVKDFTKMMRGDELEGALADILTEDQKSSYQEMKQRDRANQVEARAYKDLAKIQGVIDLSAEQKDQVYSILHEEADRSIDANKDANTMVSAFTEGLGITIDPGDLGIASVVQVQIDRAANGEQPEPQNGDWQKTMQENRQKEIDQKVEALAPVLDDAQEQTYRAHLESQGAGLLGGLLQGGNIEVEQFEIPATPAPEKE